MQKALRRDKSFYRYLARLTATIALQNLITFSLGLIDTLMSVSWETQKWPPSPPPTCRYSC